MALAGAPSFDGVALASDSLSFSIDRARDHDLTWPIAAPGVADYWVAQLFEVTNVANTTTIVYRHGWIVNDPHVVIAPASLPPNKYYLIAIIALAPYPNAATGDFRTIGYPAKPYGSATTWSALFRVTN
jgi:hypothetical protein